MASKTQRMPLPPQYERHVRATLPTREILTNINFIHTDNRATIAVTALSTPDPRTGSTTATSRSDGRRHFTAFQRLYFSISDLYLSATSLQNDQIWEGFLRLVQPALRRPCGCCLPVAVWMCPSRSERKTAAPRVKPLPLNARSRSALRGCARLGKNKRLLSHLNSSFRNSPASAFSRHTLQSADALNHFRSQTPPKRLASGLGLPPTFSTCYITEVSPVTCATNACDHTASS